MISTKITWGSWDPVRNKVDFYPVQLSRKIEEKFISGNSQCVLGSDLFNATVHLQNPNGFYQTTPAQALGRFGFKQPGYRSVFRKVFESDSYDFDLDIVQIHGEYRISNQQNPSISSVTKNISCPTDYMFESQSSSEENQLSYWEANDLLHFPMKDIVFWSWCKGSQNINTSQILNFDNNLWVPYSFAVNRDIENTFKENGNIFNFEHPLTNEQMHISMVSGQCYGFQRSQDGTKERLVMRRIIKVRDLNLILNNRSTITPEFIQSIASIPSDSIPNQFCCSITQDIMIDPVKTIDGQTYERYAIERWFEHNVTSPLTGLRLEQNGTVDLTLTPNTQLSDLIRQFVESNSINSAVNQNNQESLEDTVLSIE